MRSDDRHADVVIVGGGFSGTMLAAHLARRNISAIMIEGGQRAGRGTAFSTPELAHLLNVPAARMSAWPDRPDDFANHVAEHGFGPGDFVPRLEFGNYLHGVLTDALRGGHLRLVDRAAVDVVRADDAWIVKLDGQDVVAGRALVLAQGNQPPEMPRTARGLPPHLFVNDPWSEVGRALIAQAAADGGDILAVGTGLTMVDVALSLAEAGHRGRILAVSRRGLIPRSHEAHEAYPVAREEVPNGSLTRLWRWLRERGELVGWRAAVDSLRPHSQALWNSLSERDQQRFLRHARPWWDVHRHRIAPQVGELLARMTASARLNVMAGRVKSIRAGDHGIDVDLQPRGTGDEFTRSFALAVNCTGPLGNLHASTDGLLRSLMSVGLARPDHLGMGLEVDQSGRVDGGGRLWALGPLTKGKWWEIVAVPDIRQQVALVAEDIAKELHR